MHVVEAFLLVLVFVAAVALTISSFLSTVNGYLAVVKTRYQLLSEAMESNKIARFSSAEVTCSESEKHFTASGFPAALIKADAKYYYLIPSPGYVIPSTNPCAANPCAQPPTHPNTPACPPSPCCQAGRAEVLNSARAFLVLPNGTVLATP